MTVFLIKILNLFLIWFKPVSALNFIERRKEAYLTQWVEDLPDVPDKRTVYITGGRKYPYHAVVPCPLKSCEKMAHLEISRQFKKRWKYKEHTDGTLTLTPSIHMSNSPCGCHYWIRKGCVEWSEWPTFFAPPSPKN